MAQKPWYENEREAVLRLAGLAVDDPSISLADLRKRTGYGADVHEAAYPDPDEFNDAVIARQINEAGSDTALALYAAIANIVTPGQVVYVKPGGDDSNDGDTWANAKATIGGAITELGSNGTVMLATGTYIEPAKLTVPNYVSIIGAGPGLTIIKKDHSDAIIDSLGTGARLQGLTLNAENATDGAAGVKIIGLNGHQRLVDVNITGTDGPCLEFERQAGSQFMAVNLSVQRRAAATGTGRYSITFPSGTPVSGAVPRSFVNLQTNGTCAIDFGACDNVYIANSTLGDLNYTDNSRAVSIMGGRILNQAALTVLGHNNSIVGVDVLPQITIGPGADNITIGPGSFNNLPVIDNSGNPQRNLVNHWRVTWSTTAAAGVTTSNSNFSLGDGTVSAYYSRTGVLHHVEMYLQIGSTTDVGTGYLVFPLPETRPAIGSIRLPTAGNAIIQVGSSYYIAAVQLHGTSTFRLVTDAGLVTGASPVALASGSTIRIAFTYSP